ncbi:MAG: hypothetical protein PX640_02980 [Microcystis sp. M49629_WE12]|uniref:hypothetical protein n=1 Tax=Microcystis sp. LE19-41.2A TaxID=3016427 RepID=UPI0022C0C55A|nr:hypothetical protein [Microcystis sp. LE19-41.2A]MCZ8049991.1 hypothetical protein [Microcystis sp. LE19-41.2A]MCZ8291726.1 hypothetical protein [Microcystis sp. LE19-59.1C]MDJ0562914.1 hypothetical protein [Microcystis sp. M49629_WE12]
MRINYGGCFIRLAQLIPYWISFSAWRMYQTNPESAVVIENMEGNYERFRDYILNKLPQNLGLMRTRKFQDSRFAHLKSV